jgi:Mg2+ and Co2+ transporter CorA
LDIDIVRPNRDEVEKLAYRFPFHQLKLEDCLSKIQIPKIDRYEDHIFVILNFPTLEKERIPRSSQLAAFIGSGFLVTIHHGELKHISEIFQQCTQSEKSKQELMGRSAGYLFHSIIDALTDDLLNLVRKIVGNIEDIEVQNAYIFHLLKCLHLLDQRVRTIYMTDNSPIAMIFFSSCLKHLPFCQSPNNRKTCIKKVYLL